MKACPLCESVIIDDDLLHCESCGRTQRVNFLSELLTIDKIIPCYEEDETSIMVVFRGDRAKVYIMNNFKPGENMRVGKE